MSQPTSFITRIDRIENVVFKIEKVICAILLSAMTLTTLIEVVLRYVFKSSLIVGINELINWSFVWAVFFGMAMLIRTNEHISIGFLKNKLPKKLDLILTTIVNLALIVFGIIVINKGLEFIETQMNILTTSANIPKAYLFMATPLGMVLLIFHMIVKTIKGFAKKEEIQDKS